MTSRHKGGPLLRHGCTTAHGKTRRRQRAGQVAWVLWVARQAAGGGPDGGRLEEEGTSNLPFGPIKDHETYTDIQRVRRSIK